MQEVYYSHDIIRRNIEKVEEEECSFHFEMG